MKTLVVIFTVLMFGIQTVEAVEIISGPNNLHGIQVTPTLVVTAYHGVGETLKTNLGDVVWVDTKKDLALVQTQPTTDPMIVCSTAPTHLIRIFDPHYSIAGNLWYRTFESKRGDSGSAYYEDGKLVGMVNGVSYGDLNIYTFGISCADIIKEVREYERFISR